MAVEKELSAGARLSSKRKIEAKICPICKAVFCSNKCRQEEYFSMSISYLDLGEFAAKNKNMTGTCLNIVAYLLYHALELFVKYAILKKNGSVNKTHDISILFQEYNHLYPDQGYLIEHPFDFSSYEPCGLNIDEKKKYEKHISTFNPKFMDQHLRYPPDHRTGGYSFSFESDTFTSMKKKFMDISRKIDC